MTQQEMQLASTWVFDNDGIYKMAVSLAYPNGEWTDQSEMTDAEIEDRVPMLCKGYLSETDTNTLQADTNYLTLWRELKDRTSNINMDQLMSVSDIQKLATFLQNVTGLTNTEIAALFNRTPAQLQAFLLTKTRAEVVDLLRAKWRRLV